MELSRQDLIKRKFMCFPEGRFLVGYLDKAHFKWNHTITLDELINKLPIIDNVGYKELIYKKFKLTGKAIWYHDNHKIYRTTKFVEGKEQGEQISYNEYGEVLQTYTYDKGTIVKINDKEIKS